MLARIAVTAAALAAASWTVARAQMTPPPRPGDTENRNRQAQLGPRGGAAPRTVGADATAAPGRRPPRSDADGDAPVRPPHPPPPLMLALDADRNGELSADEISNAATALLALDRNGDGTLAGDEIHPRRPPPPPHPDEAPGQEQDRSAAPPPPQQ